MLQGIAELIEFCGIGRNRVDVRRLRGKGVERKPVQSAQRKFGAVGELPGGWEEAQDAQAPSDGPLPDDASGLSDQVRAALRLFDGRANYARQRKELALKIGLERKPKAVVELKLVAAPRARKTKAKRHLGRTKQTVSLLGRSFNPG
jgi:hypothetical protein